MQTQVQGTILRVHGLLVALRYQAHRPVHTRQDGRLEARPSTSYLVRMIAGRY